MRKYASDYCIDVVKSKLKMRWIREARGLKISDLEIFFGISRQAIYKWEDMSKKSFPSIDNLVALAKLYEVTLDELVVLSAA